MTVADQVLEALRGNAAGLTDTELAALLSKRHPHINMTCRRLADEGLVVRDGSLGSIVNRLAYNVPLRTSVELAMPPPAEPADSDWARESNVQSRVVTHLAHEGWQIISVANTASRERGVDIIAERDGTRLLAEVKGWPSTTYARGECAGQRKPTQPTLQATHWFAEGLITLIRRGTRPSTRLALALPDKPRYRTLLAEAGWAIQRMEIIVYLVEADGAVHIWEPDN
jgi:Holliday junction resolvase-like predicted endonuclease